MGCRNQIYKTRGLAFLSIRQAVLKSLMPVKRNLTLAEAQRTQRRSKIKQNLQRITCEMMYQGFYFKRVFLCVLCASARTYFCFFLIFFAPWREILLFVGVISSCAHADGLCRTLVPGAGSRDGYRFGWLKYRHAQAVPAPPAGHCWIRAGGMRMNV